MQFPTVFHFFDCIYFSGSRMGIRNSTTRMGKGRLDGLWVRIDDADQPFCSNINHLSYKTNFYFIQPNRHSRATFEIRFASVNNNNSPNLRQSAVNKPNNNEQLRISSVVSSAFLFSTHWHIQIMCVYLQ